MRPPIKRIPLEVVKRSFLPITYPNRQRTDEERRRAVLCAVRYGCSVAAYLFSVKHPSTITTWPERLGTPSIGEQRTEYWARK